MTVCRLVLERDPNWPRLPSRCICFADQWDRLLVGLCCCCTPFWHVLCWRRTQLQWNLYQTCAKQLRFELFHWGGVFAYHHCDQTQVPLGGHCSVLCFAIQALLVNCLTVVEFEIYRTTKNCAFSCIQSKLMGEWSRLTEETGGSIALRQKVTLSRRQNSSALLLESVVSMCCGIPCGRYFAKDADWCMPWAAIVKVCACSIEFTSESQIK